MRQDRTDLSSPKARIKLLELLENLRSWKLTLQNENLFLETRIFHTHTDKA